MPAPRCLRPLRSAWGGLLSVALTTSLLAGCSTGTSGDTSAQSGNPTASQPSPTTASAPASSPAPTSPQQSPDPSTSGGVDGTDGSHSGTSAPTAAGGEVPESGSGRTTPLAVPSADTPASEARGRVVRYTVEVEGGLEDLAAGFPEAVRATLTDERGWETEDGVRFVAVSPEDRQAGAETDIRIRFASPTLTDAVCAPLRTNGRLSCHDNGDVMVNAWRWVNGADTYGEDLANYRIYLVNHEVGHSIGHRHAACPGRGEKAPVMVQQTLRLDGCEAYPYPVR